MIKEKEWLGIQFNLEKDLNLKSWIKQFNLNDVDTDGEHIQIEFSKIEMERFSINSEKWQLIKEVLKKCLGESDYTNIYSHLDATKLRKEKQKLLKKTFRENLRINEFITKDSILTNLDRQISSNQTKKILHDNPMMNVLNKVFKFVMNRNFAVKQEVTIDIMLEDMEEHGTWRDNLNVSIQLEES